jgi:tRNA-dihydrouridine synthase A
MKWRACLPFDAPLAVAPMLDVTHRHCRFLHRLLSPHAVLYTEMITSAALVHGNRDRLLAFSPDEQRSGSDGTGIVARRRRRVS